MENGLLQNVAEADMVVVRDRERCHVNDTPFGVRSPSVRRGMFAEELDSDFLVERTEADAKTADKNVIYYGSPDCYALLIAGVCHIWQ